MFFIPLVQYSHGRWLGLVEDTFYISGQLFSVKVVIISSMDPLYVDKAALISQKETIVY